MGQKERIEAAIRTAKHPRTGEDLLDAGLIQSVTANQGSVIVLLEVAESDVADMEPVRKQLEDALAAVKGIKGARVIMTATRAPANQNQPAAPKLNLHSHKPAGGGNHVAPPVAKKLKGVRHVISVASGKGGVGKSTTAVNLALALRQLGLRVGLVDCDIYGPSASMLLGMDEKPKFDSNDMILPIETSGILAMSMSNIISADTAAVWRGPMVIKAVEQLLAGVVWDVNGELDVLVADMPPGTGDVQLTMAQTAESSGAIIVSTPQDLALIDARKAYDMFQKTDTPVLGIVENMSYYLCPHCGERSEIFGYGGARVTAEAKGLPFLGEIPLHMDIRQASDDGRPIVEADPDSPLADVYTRIARIVADTLELT